MQLPISPLKDRVLAELASRPVVVTAPTGSGKSTEVPRWCQHFGRVLVVEPRRMACRGLGQRVAQLERTNLGEGVGYVVRDDRRATGATRIVFATPGVVLRWLQDDGLAHFDVVLLDEFHERSLDLDLLLALLLPLTDRLRLGALSATLEADRLAQHLGGVHIHGEGRTFPVDISYIAGRTVLPDAHGLQVRLNTALARCSNTAGDVLVFLPGKGEIRRMAQLLGDKHGRVVQLHGGLSLKEQSAVFRASDTRRIILSTNVAETSVTLPSIEVVIDSGLVRRTRYHRGRASLTLTSIATDSADQRAGRAGRVKAGACFRLWSERAPLIPRTPPEIHRESLVPLVLAASACGASVHDLPFLDAPRPYAVDDAEQVLRDLGAIDERSLTDRGRRLFQLPLDAPLGRLLVQAESDGTLDAIIDLVAALQVPRSMFRGRPEDPQDDLRDAGCDAVALIRAVREGKASRHHLDAYAVDEARNQARRLRRLFGVGRTFSPIDRRALAMTILVAWPRCAHVVRRRKRDTAWSAGGTELTLGRDCAIDEDKVDFALVLGDRSVHDDRDKERRIITAAMPVPSQWLLAAGLGVHSVAEAVVNKGVVVARVRITYAKKVLTIQEQVPKAQTAREAFVYLLTRGKLFAAAVRTTRDRLVCTALAAALDGDTPQPVDVDVWLADRVQELGVESGDDLAMLSAHDFLAPPLPPWRQEELDRNFPRKLKLGDTRYQIEYRPHEQLVRVTKLSGRRKEPPPLHHLGGPRSWRVVLRDNRGERVLRGRR